MIWLDVLDSPLIGNLDLRFYEEYSQPRTLQSAEGPRDGSLRRYGAGSLLPMTARQPGLPHSPLFSYKWPPTLAALERLTEADDTPYDGRALAYTNPTSGGAVMPTIDCSVSLLPAGSRTKAHRHTTNTLYHVVEGSGYSVIDGVRFDWERSDTFCVPNWCWHEHAAASGERAILFAASDLPVIDALNVYREQAFDANGRHQTITSVFDGRR
jgi:gentisate 1,2-dioxygenase